MTSPSPSLRSLSLSALAAACTLALATGCAVPSSASASPTTPPATSPAPLPQQELPAPKPARPAKPGRIAQADANLPVTLAADKAEYRRGETLRFTITVKNVSAQEQKLAFSSGQSFDIVARRADENGAVAADAPEAWRWAADKIFTRALRAQTLRPGEELSFSATWDQSEPSRDGEGTPGPLVQRGTYVLAAEIASNPRLAATPITIQLEN